MNELQIFNYRDTPLRTVEKDGELWWALKDVCEALEIVDSKSVPRRLEPDEVDKIPLQDSRGHTQETYIVNEPGLYNVILRSNKPEAKDFKRWVTHEVLPSIRQKGTYSVPAMSPAQLIAAQAQLLVDMEKRMDEMQGQTRALEAKVDTAMKALSRPAEDHWRGDMDKAIKELNADMGWSLPKLRGKLFAELEQTVNCNLNMRVTALRNRMKKTGMRYRDAKELGKLDAIAADKQLRAIFEGIVRSYQAQVVPAGEVLLPFQNLL
mgnify:CR=1 FL=1